MPGASGISGEGGSSGTFGSTQVSGEANGLKVQAEPLAEKDVYRGQGHRKTPSPLQNRADATVQRVLVILPVSPETGLMEQHPVNEAAMVER